MVSYYFMMCEALYNYIIISNIGSLRQFVSLKSVIIFGFRKSLDDSIYFENHNMYSINFVVSPVPFCFGVSWIYWNQLDSQFSCWLNIGENFSIATFFPLCSFIAIGIIALESVGIEVRKIGEICFMDMDLRINAA